MLLLLTLLACGSGSDGSTPSRPSDVPDGAVAVRLTADGVQVDGTQILEREPFEADLTDGIDETLLAALPKQGTEAWIDAPGDTPWMLVRKLVVTADAAEKASRWVSAGGPEAYGPSEKPRARYRPSCSDGPLPVEGVSRRVSVELFAGTDGVWLEAAVLFAPTIEGQATLGLPERCWTGADCAQASNPEACAATDSAEPAPSRVPVAGPVGCMLPIRKEAGQEAAWPPELAENLQRLGITDRDEATLLIEANVPWSVVVAVLEGFDRAKLPAPALGLPLVEGHGRPPLCTATVRDASSLQTAASRFLGSRITAAEDPATPAPE